MPPKATETSELDYQKEFSPDTRRSAWLLLKNILLHPLLFFRTFRKHGNLEGHLDEYAHRVSFGRTDHPLDDMGPVENVFSALPKMLLRSSRSVLRVQLKSRQGNQFLFRARSYDIFNMIPPEQFYKHVYDAQDNTPHEELLLRVDIVRNDVYRVRLQKSPVFDEALTPMVANDISDDACIVDVTEDDLRYCLRTRKLSLHIYKYDFRMELREAEGRLITRSSGRTDNGFGMAFDAYPMGFVRDKRHRHWYGVESFELSHDESIYGLGEHFGRMNKVGETVRLWVHEGVGNTSGRVYKAVPFYVSTRGYGVFFNQTHPMTFWVGTKEKSKVQVAVEERKLDYYLFTGNIKEVLSGYTDLTGRSPMPPKYSFGTWISRMSYRSQEEIMEVAETLRENRFPADVIHMDVSWFKTGWMCDWQFDPERFPNPKEMCDKLHEKGFRLSLWQEPYVLKGTDAWREARRGGFLAACEAPFIFCGQFEGAPIDFTNPDAARWYQQRLLKPLLEAGVDVIKTDFGEGIQPGMVFQEGTGHSLHNVYPLLYNKAAYEITEAVHGKENAMVWGRSAYAGSQRYPVQWSGDNASSFGSMQGSLRGGLSYGLSGFTFWSQDTGGFVGEPTDELMIRWTQLSIFQSHIRYHGCYPFREPWNFSKEAQQIIREYLGLRYQLLFYLYSEAWDSAAAGLPLLRALVIDYQQDPTVHSIDDQFMCGRSILVAPVMREDARRTFYLPDGLWYDFFSKQPAEGRQWMTRDCSLEQIPVWLRGGSIIPLGPVAQNTAELTEGTPLELMVLLDQRGSAGCRLRYDRENSVDIEAKRELGHVLVSVDGAMPLKKVRVFDVAGEVDTQQIVVEQIGE